MELVELDLHLLLSLFILDQLPQVSEEIMVGHWKADMDQFNVRKSAQIMADRWKTNTRIVPYKAVKLLFVDVAVAQLCQVTLDV